NSPAGRPAPCCATCAWVAPRASCAMAWRWRPPPRRWATVRAAPLPMPCGATDRPAPACCAEAQASLDSSGARVCHHSGMETTAARTTNSTRGILLVLCAAILWGTTGTAQSFSPGTLSPYWVGALRLAIAAAFFAAYASTTRPTRFTASLRGIDWRRAMLAGTCMAVYNLAFFAGVKATGVAVGTALALGSGPIWAGLLQIPGGSAPSRGWCVGTLLAVAGGILLVLGR